MIEHSGQPTTTGGSRPSGTVPYPAATNASGWVGWIGFAATMLVLLGAFQLIQGIVAVLDEEYFLVGEDGLVVALDYAAWGWAHMVIGGVVLAAGLGLFLGQTWARVVGVMVAVTSALLNFAFVAAYPLWSAMVIALDVLVVLALAVHGAEMKEARGVVTRVPRQESRS